MRSTGPCAERRLAGAALDVWYRYPTERRADVARAPALPRAAERAHDAARVRLDGGHAGRTRRAHRRQHRRGPHAASPRRIRSRGGSRLRRSRFVRLPFFYGWVMVAVAFVTMGVGVNARTAFSLLFPPILDEFGWERGMTAGAFSFGFLVSAVAEPVARPADGPARAARRHGDGRGPGGAGLLLAHAGARSRGISTPRSACWWAAAASASATPARRSSCRTGSCAGGASR